jgi:O-acetyl-ADP-ribose deacetylase (regulator of RNase III)
MLTYVRTSILDSRAQTVTNTVNTVGVMGKGLASAMKQRYPEMFKGYSRLCAEKKLHIGQLWLWKAPTRWILNFPTKKHWRNPSKLYYIEAGLQKFVSEYERRGIWEIAFPRLGCGNGNLDWGDVRPLMERYLSNLPIQIYVHDYEVDLGPPEHIHHFSNIRFEGSFPKFITDLAAVIYAHRGNFHTIQSKKPYMAKMVPDVGLKIEREGRTGIVCLDELFELWTLMLRGPVTRGKLVGRARSDAYYIFPILRELPYIRAIELQPKGATMPAIAMELDDETEPREALTTSGVQGELAWH